MSGTIGNIRRRNTDLRAAALIGVAACTTTALGAWIATIVDPLVGNILFAAFLTFIAVQMALRAIRAQRERKGRPPPIEAADRRGRGSRRGIGRMAGCQ